MKSICILFLVLFPTSLLAQTAYQKYLDSLGFAGSTTIFDSKHQKWIYTDQQDALIATLPASTFKIPNSLMALEFNALKNKEQLIRWDGKKRFIEAWNHDTNLEDAYKNSTVWFYEEVARRIGKETYRRILNEMKYGNGLITEEYVNFWLEGEFAISPKEQIEFLIKLYHNSLPFSDSTMNTVKEIMISKHSDHQIMRDKTGWATRTGKEIGWHVGYMETSDNVYFFATRLTKKEDGETDQFLKARKEATNLLLNSLMGITRP